MTKLSYIYTAKDGRKFNVATYPQVRDLVNRKGGTYKAVYTKISGFLDQTPEENKKPTGKRAEILARDGVIRPSQSYT